MGGAHCARAHPRSSDCGAPVSPFFIVLSCARTAARSDGSDTTPASKMSSAASASFSRGLKLRECSLLLSAIEDALDESCVADAPSPAYAPGGASTGSTHVAVIIKRSKILSVGTNRAGSRSCGSGFSSYSLHAERAAVKALGDLSRLRGAELFVLRVPAAGHVRGSGVAARDLLFSRPCHECTVFLEKCMRVWGLRRVFYSTDMNFALEPPSCLKDVLARAPDDPVERWRWEQKERAARRCGALAGDAKREEAERREARAWGSVNAKAR